MMDANKVWENVNSRKGKHMFSILSQVLYFILTTFIGQAFLNILLVTQSLEKTLLYQVA